MQVQILFHLLDFFLGIGKFKKIFPARLVERIERKGKRFDVKDDACHERVIL